VGTRQLLNVPELRYWQVCSLGLKGKMARETTWQTTR